MSRTGWMMGAMWALTWTAAQAQYNVTTLLINGTKIPNFSENWNVNPGTPPSQPLSIWGKYVALVQCADPPCNGFQTDGIWVEDWTTKTFTQLVAPGVVPLGENETELTSFGDYAVVSQGWVVFMGFSAGGNGFYSVPVTGGKVHVIADQNTTLPGLNAPATSYSFGNNTGDLPAASNGYFVFHAASVAGSGVFQASLSGSELQAIAFTTMVNNVLVGDLVVPQGLLCTIDPASVYQQPRIYGSTAGTNVAFVGQPNVGAPTWLFVTPLTGFPNTLLCPTSGYIEYPATVSSTDNALPGEPPTVAFDGSYIAIDNQNEYFEVSGDGSRGVFLVNSKGISPVVTTTQSLPGVGPPYAPLGGTQGIAAENGTLAFSLNGEYGQSPQNAGLFSYRGGKITRIAVGSGLGTADILGGIQGYSWAPPIGPNSISDSRIVFSFGRPGETGVFLASPATCATDVTSEVKITQTPPHFDSTTGDYYSKVTITNTGTSAIAAPVSAVFDGLTNVVATYGTVIPQLLNKTAGATTCLSPLGEADLYLNSGKALTPGETATLTLVIAYPPPPKAPFSYTTRVVSGKIR